MEYSLFLVVLMAATALVPVISGDRRFCGPGLTDALKLLCNGRYRSRSAEKRSLPEVRTARDIEETHGIVEECCTKSCKLTTLMAYCAEPPDQLFLSALENSKKFESSTKPDIVDTTTTPPSSDNPEFSRLKSALSSFTPLDLSSLHESVPDAFQSMPSRQKRHRLRRSIAR